MSADTVDSAVGTIRGRKKVVAGGVGGALWLWLLARWAAHNTLLDSIFTAIGLPDLIRSEVRVGAREPWIPAAPFEAVADALDSVAAAVGPLEFLVEWLAWPFEVAAFATSTGPALAEGAFITVYLTVISMALGLVIAVPLAVTRVYGGLISSWISLAYTELIRGTPLLAQLFFFYFGLPLAGIVGSFEVMNLSGMPRTAAVVAIVAFTVNSSAYQAEYIRAALQSVDEGQLTAARAVGLSKREGIRHVVLPQGLRFAIPGWTNEFVYLIKYSSLAAFITVPDMFRRARDIGSDTFQYTEIYVVVGLCYLGLVLTTAMAMQRLEDRVAVPGVGQSAGRE
ncbi:amino acid ABC transporter permease [Halohasta litorea]|uniref:Amino acid ABC transporter permease n=1 Tax=Halohasta litorea TaxID=869891 RepID=A0ABD6D5J4_9EURY|nr:amino acid ABC transporter permease [Halohasta litorea]